ncbi:hypothetical protein [Tepidibacter hydrothermalis]|uniref:Uncharacterized protein n=1 Tax=Tepidibacter hydrothermalis TaxID=3036126 RepID=A0ABY8ECL5_9FIRM|nr:hypothetical protein [Tepidibacter hydrothermalis]WFD10668.1 hypothetical protein P4S50_00940 [Tepidibacter hydrothermalis]
MLDYKNENWWVYNLGIIVCGVGLIIVGIIRFLNRKNLGSESVFILMNIPDIMSIIGFGLLGTREVFAKNERIGYLYYFIMIVTLVLS